MKLTAETANHHGDVLETQENFQSFMNLSHDIATAIQEAMAPPPAFLFLHIQLSKSNRNDIDPNLAFGGQKGQQLPRPSFPGQEADVS